jgi:hypothetical protein
MNSDSLDFYKEGRNQINKRDKKFYYMASQILAAPFGTNVIPACQEPVLLFLPV